MGSELSPLVLLVLSSCMLVGGRASCCCYYYYYSVLFSTTTASAESVGGSTPGVRVTWNTTAPLECVTSVRVEFRNESYGPVATYNTTNASETEIVQTDLQCATEYYITVVLIAEVYYWWYNGVPFTLQSGQVQVIVGDTPVPVSVRAEVTADNTSIRVSWEWSCQGVIMCVDIVTVQYQPEGGSLIMYTVDNTTATSATLPNLQCNTKYTVWIYVESGSNNTSNMSSPRMVALPARAPPTPTEVTAEAINTSSVRVAWRWTSSGPAPNCFNTTTMTYRPEGGGKSFLQLSDPAATEATLTDLQCNTNYTITVVATAGEHRREGVAFLPLTLQIQDLQNLSASVLSSTSIHLTWVAPCHTRQYHIYYRGTCGTYVEEGRVDTNHQEYSFDGLQEGVNYSFTVNQTGFIGGRVLSTGPVYARTFTAVPSGAPQSLEGMFQVSLSWREVPCIKQNGPITGYAVRYYATCGADRDVQRYKSVRTMDDDDIIDGLTPNTEYSFQVAAVNANGTGPFSEPITLGGAPQLVMTTPVNSTTVTVSWSEVQCFNESGAVTHYLVQYQSSCGGVVWNVTTSGTVQTVSGLEPNCVYTFRVAAVGASQRIGPFSNPVNASLPVPTQCTPTLAVAGVAVTAVLVLLVVAVVQSAVIWHQRKSIAGIKSQTQRATTEISFKECSAYEQIYQGDEREEPHIYECPQ